MATPLLFTYTLSEDYTQCRVQVTKREFCVLWKNVCRPAWLAFYSVLFSEMRTHFVKSCVVYSSFSFDKIIVVITMTERES